eukprot:917284-Prymnesium_polylepis.1
MHDRPGEDRDRVALHTLGLNDRASPEEIRESYHALARRWHPDLHTDASQKAVAEAEFKKIGEAFATLQRRLPVA